MRKLLVALGGLFLCLTANAQNVAVGSLTASGADCTTAGACITLQFEGNDVASSSIQLSGTFTATVQFEASSDKGTTWVAISGTPLNSTTAVTSATTANTWKFNVASLTNIRARCSAFTSAPTVIIRSSRAVANAIGGGGAVFASGGTTNNVIPKSNGSSQLANSSLTDDGTTVTGTEPIVVPAGTLTSPSLQWAESTANAGWFRNGANNYEFSIGNSTVQLRVLSATNGNLIIKDGLSFSTNPDATTPDLFVHRRGAANLRLGVADLNGTPVDQTLSVQNAITGTNLPGGHFTIDAPAGTGTGATAKISINRALMAASGGTAQTAVNAFAVGQSKTLSNTSATAQAIATITLGSNAGGGASGIFTLVCTDGTNFDSETQSFNVSFVNKAAAVTVGTPAITTSTAANNSGSCTLGITAVANGNNIDLKVTPVFTTIVPTTVTLYPIITHSTNTVTFN